MFGCWGDGVNCGICVLLMLVVFMYLLMLWCLFIVCWKVFVLKVSVCLMWLVCRVLCSLVCVVWL